MRNTFHVKAALLVLASAGFSLSAQASHPTGMVLTTGEARDLATHAASYEDHLRLAAYYSARADKAKANLVKEESLMQHWANVEGMADRTKVPNPYSIAKTMAEVYRAELAKDTQLASEQQNAATSIQSHGTASE